MSNVNFIIEISEKFLSRFPKEQQDVARARAQYLLYNIIGEGDWVVMGRSMQTHLSYFEPRAMDIFPHEYKNVPYPPISDYFDDEAVVHVDFLDEQHSVPAINLLCANTKLFHEYLHQLKDIVANHASMTATRSFASPLMIAFNRKNWPMIDLLSYNPHLDPNEPWNGNLYDRLVIGKDGTTPLCDFAQNKGMTPLEMMFRYNNAQGALDRYYNQPNYSFEDTINRFIDNGAAVTALCERYLDRTHFEEIKRHIGNIREHLEAVDVSACTAQDMKHAYAMGSLNRWFQDATANDEIRDRLIALREELPSWLSEKLDPAYQILNATTWVERTDGESQGFAGRFA